ncbi:methyltransferase [Hyphococcus sp. DH-69]|uniref:methyltransferase n=1 Tax=Hyphococcus formosus TaxID=3143534 RepID=UPI00398BBB86
MNDLNPGHILQTATAFFPAKVLLSATELGLFTKLSEKPMNGVELCNSLGLHPRANPDFFDTLVALKFLLRDGNGSDATYQNTPETAAFLNKSSPAYIGGFLEMANARLYHSWGDLTEALRTGKAQNELKNSDKPLFDAIYDDPARLEQFIDAMTGIQIGNIMALAEKFDFSGYKTLCDVGGSGATLARAIALGHPNIKCISADLPAVTAIAKKRIADSGLSDRIDAIDLDFFKDSFPKVDIITMGNILHDWNLDVKKMLITKAYEALPSGGAFIAIENIIDDERRENAFGLLMSLNMLVETGDGFDYTGADFDGWCKEVGFSRTEILPLAGPTSAAIAYK